MKSSPGRIVGVTAALLACGAVFGGVAAVLAALLAFTITEGPASGFLFDALSIAGVIGALLGGVLLPAACWLLLRRVPLGLAFVGTVLGTVAGGVLGWVFGFSYHPVIVPIAGGFLGFLFATIFLRARFSAPRTAGDRPIGRPASA